MSCTLNFQLQLVLVACVFQMEETNIEMMSVCHRRSDERKWREQCETKHAHTLEERTKRRYRQFIIFICYLNQTYIHTEHGPFEEFSLFVYYLWCVAPHSKPKSGGRALKRQFEPFELNFATVLSILEMHFDCMCGRIEAVVHRFRNHTIEKTSRQTNKRVSEWVCVHPLIRLSRTLCM